MIALVKLSSSDKSMISKSLEVGLMRISGNMLPNKLPINIENNNFSLQVQKLSTNQFKKNQSIDSVMTTLWNKGEVKT